MQNGLLYQRAERPFGNTWEKWVALWCNWMLSIPKQLNPTVDQTGQRCPINQKEVNVWFLTGTFGNNIHVKRKCTIPDSKAIFFPVLEKEVSYAEDLDLTSEAELFERARNAMDGVLQMEATIDGQHVENLSSYRVQTQAFDLTFPENNVYNVRPGKTRSVCDGFWVFIKPMQAGKHSIHFKGETSVTNSTTLTQLRNNEVHSSLWNTVDNKLTFRLEVSYDLTIIIESR